LRHYQPQGALGGMRILENTQPLIVHLIKKLNADVSRNEQIELYPFPVNQPPNIAYLRGVYLRLSDISANSPKVPYNLAFTEKENMNNIFEGVAEGESNEAVESSVLNQQWKQYEAPKDLVTEMARQLQMIHDLPYTPVVRNASFKDWGDDPFGGGWNSWNIGVNSMEVKHKIVNPIDGCPLFICGEAYSDGQGWGEGALQTAGYVLKKLEHCTCT
jgi:hypothetical protein